MICVKCKQEVPDAPFCCQCGASQSPPKKPQRKRGNNMGTAIKRGRTWTVIVSVGSYHEELDGKKRLVRLRRSKGGFRTKTEALEYAPTLAGKIERNPPTILELWSSWSKNDMAKLSHDKQTAYKIAKDRLKPIWGRPIDSLITDELQAVVSDSVKTYYPARDMKSLLSHLFQRAMADQFVTINLAKFIVLPELEESEPVPFSEFEIKKMWNAYGDGDTFLGYILLMIYSGMMPAELMSCKKDMINWDTCEIYGCGKKTKRRKEVPIVFSDFVKPVLEDLCDLSTSKSGKLLCMNKDNFYKTYHGELQKIGIRDLPPYSCRHTTATDAVKKNIAPSVVQQLMRHSKITTTQRYIHVGAAEAHAAANALEKGPNCTPQCKPQN